VSRWCVCEGESVYRSGERESVCVSAVCVRESECVDLVRESVCVCICRAREGESMCRFGERETVCVYVSSCVCKRESV